MANLGATEYVIKSAHTNGPIGDRYVVQSQLTGAELLADVVSPDEDEYLAVLCKNALRTRRWTEDPTVANVLEAGWLPDGRYFQVLDMSPLASLLSDRQGALAEQQEWVVAQSLVASLRHLHRRELVHGAVAPACMYQDGGRLRLAELWFAHNADGEPLYGELSSYFPARPPEFALPFMSPEVLLGEPPERESDIYSAGALLFYLLTGESPRDLAPPYPDEAAWRALAVAPVKPLAVLWPDLSKELEGLLLSMLMTDPAERPTIFLLEAICKELVSGASSMSATDSRTDFEEKRLEYSPLSAAVSATLELSGKPVAPGKLVNVARRLSSGGIPWLTLANPAGGLDGQYCVRWVLRERQRNFALLEKPNEYWDPNLRAAPQVLVRVLDENTLLTLTADEFNRTVTELRAEVANRQEWPASMWQSAFAEDVAAAFGRTRQAVGPVGIEPAGAADLLEAKSAPAEEVPAAAPVAGSEGGFLTSSGAPEPQPLIQIDEPLVAKINDEFGLSLDQRLSDPQLRALEKTARLEPNTLAYDGKGKLVLKASGEPQVGFQGMLDDNAAESGKGLSTSGRLKTGSAAVFALAKRYGLGQKKVAEESARKSERKK